MGDGVLADVVSYVKTCWSGSLAFGAKTECPASLGIVE